MERQDGMLRTGQVLAAGISKPVFYQFVQYQSATNVNEARKALWDKTFRALHAIWIAPQLLLVVKISGR